MISIVIPTYNRGAELVRCLKSLINQRAEKFEIIVVDQSDKQFQEKDSYLRRLGTGIRYYQISPPSAPAAKNFGIRQAKGSIVLFLDDDVIAQPGLIAAHYRNYSDKTISGIVGRVITPGQPVMKNFRCVGRITPWGKFLDGYSSAIRQEVSNVIGCNCSWRKASLLRVGGFDQNFIGNALREESDLALRIKADGGRIFFDPQARVIHARAISGGCRKDNRLKWYADYFHNEAYFFHKHLSGKWWFLFWLIRWQYFARCMFGFGREVSWHSLILPFKSILGGYLDYRR